MRVILAVVTLLGAGAPALAASDLDNTVWHPTNAECTLDRIEFFYDGTADVVDYTADSDVVGYWNMEGSRIVVTYGGDWQGSLEGTVSGRRLEAFDKRNGKSARCLFERD